MNTTAIEHFIDRYNRAVQGKSKEIRLQLNEADALVKELSIVLCRTTTLSDKLIELQEKLLNTKTNQQNTTIQMDGGSF